MVSIPLQSRCQILELIPQLLQNLPSGIWKQSKHLWLLWFTSEAALKLALCDLKLVFTDDPNLRSPFIWLGLQRGSGDGRHLLIKKMSKCLQDQVLWQARASTNSPQWLLHRTRSPTAGEPPVIRCALHTGCLCGVWSCNTKLCTLKIPGWHLVHA